MFGPGESRSEIAIREVKSTIEGLENKTLDGFFAERIAHVDGL